MNIIFQKQLIPEKGNPSNPKLCYCIFSLLCSFTPSTKCFSGSIGRLTIMVSEDVMGKW